MDSPPLGWTEGVGDGVDGLNGAVGSLRDSSTSHHNSSNSSSNQAGPSWADREAVLQGHPTGGGVDAESVMSSDVESRRWSNSGGLAGALAGTNNTARISENTSSSSPSAHSLIQMQAHNSAPSTGNQSALNAQVAPPGFNLSHYQQQQQGLYQNQLGARGDGSVTTTEVRSPTGQGQGQNLSEAYLVQRVIELEHERAFFCTQIVDLQYRLKDAEDRAQAADLDLQIQLDCYQDLQDELSRMKLAMQNSPPAPHPLPPAQAATSTSVVTSAGAGLSSGTSLGGSNSSLSAGNLFAHSQLQQLHSESRMKPPSGPRLLHNQEYVFPSASRDQVEYDPDSLGGTASPAFAETSFNTVATDTVVPTPTTLQPPTQQGLGQPSIGVDQRLSIISAIGGVGGVSFESSRSPSLRTEAHFADKRQSVLSEVAAGLTTSAELNPMTSDVSNLGVDTSLVAGAGVSVGGFSADDVITLKKRIGALAQQNHELEAKLKEKEVAESQLLNVASEHDTQLRHMERTISQLYQRLENKQVELQRALRAVTPLQQKLAESRAVLDRLGLRPPFPAYLEQAASLRLSAMKHSSKRFLGRSNSATPGLDAAEVSSSSSGQQGQASLRPPQSYFDPSPQRRQAAFLSSGEDGAANAFGGPSLISIQINPSGEFTPGSSLTSSQIGLGLGQSSPTLPTPRMGSTGHRLELESGSPLQPGSSPGALASGGRSTPRQRKVTVKEF
jgi:hypothetical protein